MSTKAKHTPGPLYAHPTETDYWDLTNELEGEGESVAHIFKEEYVTLLESASDLLAAAKATADDLSEVATELGNHNVIHDSIARLRVAIARAKGGEPC